VFHTLAGGVGVVAQAGPDAPNLVGRDAGADAASADDDAPFGVSRPYDLGYGDGDDTTVLDDMRNNYLTVYLRRTFSLADLSVSDVSERFSRIATILWITRSRR